MEPVFQKMPTLPQPDWTLLNNPEPDYNHQTREQSKHREKQLTESLHHARVLLAIHERIEEGNSAQMIIQHLEVTKLTQSLEAKESKKNVERTILFEAGKAVHFTGDDFSGRVAEVKARQEAETAEKNRRKASRLDKKAAKDALELKWKRVCAEHDAAVLDWKSCCEVLLAEGVAKKNLPVKPKRVLKSSLVQEEQDDDDSDDGENGSQVQDHGDEDSHGWEM